ncbi:hypothetical protein SCALM49S_05301 [Streptomyces californicus]
MWRGTPRLVAAATGRASTALSRLVPPYAPAGPGRGGVTQGLVGGYARGMNTTPLPLEGVTVVAVERAVAAPFATRQLADLGARVVKVERPDGGDFARGYDTAARGLASHFVWCNRGKESPGRRSQGPARPRDRP